MIAIPGCPSVPSALLSVQLIYTFIKKQELICQYLLLLYFSFLSTLYLTKGLLSQSFARPYHFPKVFSRL
jgi:hypothetical protein